MTRYFMTIPEAVQLVIQAGAIGESGDVYVLDMGPPVKIVDLARNMIRLSGSEPDRDIAIEFIGIRPGEKLQEELWGEGESPVPTAHPKILRCACHPVDPGWLEEELGELERHVAAGDTLEAIGRLAAMMHAPRRVGAQTAEPV
jgi:FlaA1/EpsC-like NDP-sugar epimerase